MTEPTRPEPVPAPPRAGRGPTLPSDSLPPGGPATATGPDHPASDPAGADAPFADLERRPVSEHVAVFEAEHARLQRELGTIDQV